MAQDEEIGRYYDEVLFEEELTRLPREFPIELAITLRVLDRHVPPGARVLEIGVGGGHYTRWLAARGCRLHLVDISRRLLDTVASAVPQALIGATHASAVNLRALPDDPFDLIISLGPFYHLLTVGERRAAVVESARLLRPGGLLIAAGINRLAYFRSLFLRNPELVLERREYHERFLRDGLLNPEVAPPIGHAHLTTIDEFRALFGPEFTELELIGVESFAAAGQASFNELAPDVAEAWLDLIERTASTIEGIGTADHWVYVGRRE